MDFEIKINLTADGKILNLPAAAIRKSQNGNYFSVRCRLSERRSPDKYGHTHYLRVIMPKDSNDTEKHYIGEGLEYVYNAQTQAQAQAPSQPTAAPQSAPAPSTNQGGDLPF